MTLIKSRRPLIDVFDDLAYGFVEGYLGDPLFDQSSTSRTLRLVNTDDYDLVPKKFKIEKDIKEKEEKLKALKSRRENDDKWYESQIKTIETEIGVLRTKIAP